MDANSVRGSMPALNPYSRYAPARRHDARNLLLEVSALVQQGMQQAQALDLTAATHEARAGVVRLAQRALADAEGDPSTAANRLGGLT